MYRGYCFGVIDPRIYLVVDRRSGKGYGGGSYGRSSYEETRFRVACDAHGVDGVQPTGGCRPRAPSVSRPVGRSSIRVGVRDHLQRDPPRPVVVRRQEDMGVGGPTEPAPDPEEVQPAPGMAVLQRRHGELEETCPPMVESNQAPLRSDWAVPSPQAARADASVAPDPNPQTAHYLPHHRLER